MTMKKIKLFLILIFCFSLIDCAKRGIPEGGTKDESPPFLINADLLQTKNLLIYLFHIIQSILNLHGTLEPWGFLDELQY